MPAAGGTAGGPASRAGGPASTAPRTLASAQDTRDWGRELAGWLRAGDLVILVGELGAGKTTFVQGLAEGLGVRGPVTSPTFVIARSHPSTVGGPALVHVDAYRLGGSLELDDLDLDTDVESAVTVVEWGEGLAESLGTAGHLVVHLDRTLAASAGSDEVPTERAGDRPDEGSEDDRGVDEPADPRTGWVAGVGPRWEGWEDLAPLR